MKSPLLLLVKAASAKQARNEAVTFLNTKLWIDEEEREEKDDEGGNLTGYYVGAELSPGFITGAKTEANTLPLTPSLVTTIQERWKPLPIGHENNKDGMIVDAICTPAGAVLNIPEENHSLPTNLDGYWVVAGVIQG